MKAHSHSRLLKTILPCMIVLLGGSAVQACDNGNLGLALLFGYNNFNNRPGVFNNYQPPYFSMHPPVYYGERYYRPYGASPFAAWPQLQPNNSYSPRLGAQSANQAIVVENPHCVIPAVSPKPLEDTSSREIVNQSSGYSGPLVIDNPYFVEEESRYTSIANRQ